MTTDLLVPQNITAIQIFEKNGLDPVLNKIKEEIDKFVPDVETDKGRKEIASFAYKIAQSKTYIEKAGKGLVSGMKATVKLIDAERKRSRDTLDAWRDEVRKPLSDYEAEQAAIEEKRRQDEIFKLDWEEALQIDDLFNREREIKKKEAEFERIAEEARQKEKAERVAKEQAEYQAQLKKEAIAQAEKAAHEKIEIERLRTIKAEQDRMAAIEQAKIEKENAEKARLEAIKQAEIEKQAAIELATRQAEERARLAKEAEDRKAAEEKAKAELAASDWQHKTYVNNQIVSAFCGIGWSESEANAVVKAVVTGKIPFMVIQY